jgi:hypothetical protein
MVFIHWYLFTGGLYYRLDCIQKYILKTHSKGGILHRFASGEYIHTKYFCISSDPTTLRNVADVWFATALASNVFPARKAS